MEHIRPRIVVDLRLSDRHPTDAWLFDEKRRPNERAALERGGTDVSPVNIGEMRVYPSVRPRLSAGVHDVEMRQTIDQGGTIPPVTRHVDVTAPRFKLSDNALISGHAASPMVRRGFIDRAQARAFVDRITKTYDVRKGKPDPEAVSLSGGNLQKYVVGREILREPRLLVVSQPTWGVDAGAAAAIRQAIIDLAARGAAVLVMSQDLDELYEISDRLVVICGGRLSAPRQTRRADRGEIGMLMAGVGMKGATNAARP